MTTFDECIKAQAVVDAYQEPILRATETYFYYAEGVTGVDYEIEYMPQDDDDPPKIVIAAQHPHSSRYLILEPPMVEQRQVVDWIEAKIQVQLDRIEQEERQRAANKKKAQDRADLELLERLKVDHPDWNLSIP